MAQFLDSHAHLDSSEYDADRDGVIQRARDAGLKYLLLIGSSSARLDSALSIAEDHDWTFASAGVHPHEARLLERSHLDELRKLAHHDKFLAIGEIGLDYYYEHSLRDVQKQALITQMELANELKLPIIIHCRDAWPDLAEIVGPHWSSTGLGGVLHCFSGTLRDAMKFLDWGFLISFAGNITFKKADPLRAIAREVPLDRLLTETDSPYLSPVPYRGKRNEPAYVIETTRTLGSLRNMNESEMGEQVIGNFQSFFALR